MISQSCHQRHRDVLVVLAFTWRSPRCMSSQSFCSLAKSWVSMTTSASHVARCSTKWVLNSAQKWNHTSFAKLCCVATLKVKTICVGTCSIQEVLCYGCKCPRLGHCHMRFAWGLILRSTLQSTLFFHRRFGQGFLGESEGQASWFAVLGTLGSDGFGDANDGMVIVSSMGSTTNSP